MIPNLKKMVIKPLPVKTWLKYKKVGLGRRVKIKPIPYLNARLYDHYLGAAGQYGTVVALYLENSQKIPDAYGVVLDKAIFNGTDLSVLNVFEKYIVRMTACEFGHGIWIAGDRLEFL